MASRPRPNDGLSALDLYVNEVINRPLDVSSSVEIHKFINWLNDFDPSLLS